MRYEMQEKCNWCGSERDIVVVVFVVHRTNYVVAIIFVIVDSEVQLA